MPEIVASTYEVIEKIGAGGGGNVYLANHLRLGKPVVLKADKRKITTRPELLRREVDVLKDLSHTYIPQVYDFFVEGETVYTVMAYIEGESLDRPLKRGERFTQPQVIKWAIQLLEALCYLHSPTHGNPPRGFVHSDIKPANMMLTPNDDICLIDFNIALALGEDNVIGCSDGYASPEHYGLDFSSEAETATLKRNPAKIRDTDETVTLLDDDRTVTDVGQVISGSSGRSSSSSKRFPIVPDVRSDIYSTGATLYHLLKGEKPARHAKEVIPLSEKEFSPPLVKIITKAMNPNPDLRYQSAEDMLFDFIHIRENDPRVKRLKWNRRIAAAMFAAFLVAGAGTAFVGLKRMETTESWLKLAEYSKNALKKGNVDTAVQYALQALPPDENVLYPDYTSEAQRVLAEALAVYDLKDDFKSYGVVELPSAPINMKIAPNGTYAACIYSGALAIIDVENREILTTLPIVESALAEVEFLDNETILYAGKDGLISYNISQRAEKWKGSQATSIAVSADRSTIASIYKDENHATIYDAKDGSIQKIVEFGDKHQYVTVNDSFANPNNNLLALSANGEWLGTSFADGSLMVYNLKKEDSDLNLFDETAEFTHFEGGFYKDYFAFSATGEAGSIFAVIDMVSLSQTGGFESESAFSVETDETGIFVQTENLLVNIDPVTGDQIPLVTTSEWIKRYARSDAHTLITSETEFMFFDEYATLVSAHAKETSGDFVQIANGTALVGSLDSPMVRIMKYESHREEEIFSYDPTDVHDEARVSADGNYVTLFRYDGFRVFSVDGALVKEVEIPNANQVYDQQYIRADGESSLLVIYNDGKVVTYDATNGEVVEEKKEEKKNDSLDEEFYTDSYRIKSPLHGVPTVYDIESGKQICQLEGDAYLTYVTQSGNYLVTQYVTADGECYGQLLNEKCEILADLPYLCDVIEDRLIFDYPTGNLRATRIYNINELIALAQK